MRLLVGVGLVRGALLAAVGAVPAVACAGSESGGEPVASGGTGAGGAGNGGATGGNGGSGGARTGGRTHSSGGMSSGGADGGSTTGGASAVTGGTTSAGGTTSTGGAGGTVAGTGGAGGVSATGGATNAYVCKNPRPIDGPGYQTGPGYRQCADGLVQRLPGFTCTNGIVPTEGPNVTLPPESMLCRTHGDCTERPYGRCYAQTNDFGGVIGTRCSYGCVADGDCQEGSVCACGNPVGSCVTGCGSDAECPNGEPCALISKVHGCLQSFELQCGVDCTTDEDCRTIGTGAGTCVSGGCQSSPTCGRPFLVEGAARVAPRAIRADWADSMTPSTAHLSPGVREALAAHWTQVALMEHASVAAFARFTLQLLSLGAPSSLVEAGTAALADETAHARLCFGIASAYAGRDVGPGPLPMDRALAAGTFTDIVHTAFLEACIGETTAALEAAECAAHAEDPVIAAALRRIAADETRHAELGWKFVTWALETSDDEQRCALLEDFRELATAGAVFAMPARGDALLAHGVASAALSTVVRRAAIRDVVGPCVDALAARFEAGTRMAATCASVRQCALNQRA